MNLDLGAMDAKMRVASLSVAWQGVDFTAPHRTFVKEGELVKTDRHGRGRRPLQSFLRVLLHFTKRRSPAPARRPAATVATGLRKRYCFLLFNDLMAFGNKLDESGLFRLMGGGGAGESDTGRYRLRFKAPLLECLVIDDNMVYGKGGALRLRPDDPQQAAMMAATAKGGGDMSRLSKAFAAAGGPAGELEQAWTLLESCGASMERILESQLDEDSFMIQAAGKTLFLTAAGPAERREWVAALAAALAACRTEERSHRDGRRMSTLGGGPRAGGGVAGGDVVANESVIAKGYSKFRGSIANMRVADINPLRASKASRSGSGSWHEGQ